MTTNNPPVEQCDLLPCPFCGSEIVESVAPSLGRSNWRMVCDDCGAEGPLGKSDVPFDDMPDDTAIAAWNSRATHAQPDREAIARVIASKLKGLFGAAMLRDVCLELADALISAALAGDRGVIEACARVAECHSDDRPRRDGIDWNDGYQDGCRGAAAAIRNLP